MLNKEKGGFPAVRPCGPLWGLFRGRVGYLRHQEVLGRFGPAFTGDIRRGLDDEKKAGRKSRRFIAPARSLLPAVRAVCSCFV